MLAGLAAPTQGLAHPARNQMKKLENGYLGETLSHWLVRIRPDWWPKESSWNPDKFYWQMEQMELKQESLGNEEFDSWGR